MTVVSRCITGSMCRIFLPVLLLWIALTNVVTAQPVYDIRHYTNEHGLPAQGIKGFELDEQTGFLWIGTQAGLVRFDGKEFKTFSYAEGMEGYRIANIVKGRDGAIYCADDNFSIYKVNNYKPVLVGKDSIFQLPTNVHVRDYIARNAPALIEKIKRIDQPAFVPGWAAFRAGAGGKPDFYLAFLGRGYYYNARLRKLYEFSDCNKLLGLGDEIYFVRRSTELWHFDRKTEALTLVPVAGMPSWNGKAFEKGRFIWKASMNAPLFMCNEDLWKLEDTGSGLALQPVCSSCCPPNANVSSVLIWEAQHKIFFGSEQNGLYQASTRFIRPLRADASKEAVPFEYAQAEITPGVITTARGNSFTLGTTQPAPVPSRYTLPGSIFKDGRGDYWSSSGDTIIHYHHETGHYTKIPVGNGAFKIAFGETMGQVYAVSDLAIARVSHDGYEPLYMLKDHPQNSKRTLNPDMAVEWKPGVLAIAGERLFFFDVARRQIQNVAIRGLRAKTRSLYKFGDYLFIGTYGQGLYVYRDGVTKKMPLDKNRYLAYAHCFMPDDKGFCWISTNRGLFKASFSALTAAYEQNLPEIYYHYFGKEDGIYNTELNGGCQPCGIRTAHGMLSFPSMDGLVTLDPGQRHAPPPSGKVFIEEAFADSSGYQLNTRETLLLPEGIRTLRFRVALSQFGNPENIYCSYKLDPHNDQWESQDITRNKLLTFGGLAPGLYHLHIRIRNGFEAGEFRTTTYTFRVQPSWYQTWWFRVAVLLFTAFLVWCLVLWRTARIRKRQRELQLLVNRQTRSLATQSRQLETQLTGLRTQQIKLEEDNKVKARLISIISHDMLSPLKFMSYMSHKMIKTTPPSDQNLKTVQFIASVSQDLETLTTNLLNWIGFHHNSFDMQAEWFSLAELVHRSLELPKTLASEKGVALHAAIPPDIALCQYQQAVGVITYNLAMNAAKYTESGEIRITAVALEEGVLLVCSDSGPGMPEDMVARLNDIELSEFNYFTNQGKKYQFGYAIIKDLLRLSQGTMTVESTGGKGTEIQIRFRNLAPGTQQGMLLTPAPDQSH